MRENGRPNLGYSNLYWSRIEQSPQARIFNREALIQEVLEEPVQIPLEENIDRLQLMSLNSSLKSGVDNDETRCIKIIERDENDRHIDDKTYRNAI